MRPYGGFTEECCTKANLVEGTGTGQPWRYLLIDVDGTLLNSAGRITPRSRAALARAVGLGKTLVLASGRTYPSLLRAAAPLGLPFYLISNGGAVGLGPAAAPAEAPAPAMAAAGMSVRYVNCLPPQLWPEVVEVLLGEGLSAVVFAHRHPRPPLFYVASTGGDPHFESYIGRHREYCRIQPRLAEASIPGVVEVAALGSGQEFDAASARAMERLAGRTRSHSMVLFLSAKYGKITEFFQPDTSKWQAFLAMFPQAAARPGLAVAIGDEANDAEMIAGAGLGIAMGNATAELRRAAARVTADNDHDGLAEALEPLLDG